MASYPCDVLFDLALLGNVLVGADPASIAHRLMANSNHPSIRELPIENRFLSFDESLLEVGEHLLGRDAGTVYSASNTVPHQVDQLRTRLRINGIEAIHVEIPPVDDDDAQIPIEGT